MSGSLWKKNDTSSLGNHLSLESVQLNTTHPVESYLASDDRIYIDYKGCFVVFRYTIINIGFPIPFDSKTSHTNQLDYTSFLQSYDLRLPIKYAMQCMVMLLILTGSAIGRVNMRRGRNELNSLLDLVSCYIIKRRIII